MHELGAEILSFLNFQEEFDARPARLLIHITLHLETPWHVRQLHIPELGWEILYRSRCQFRDTLANDTHRLRRPAQRNHICQIIDQLMTL